MFIFDELYNLDEFCKEHPSHSQIDENGNYWFCDRFFVNKNLKTIYDKKKFKTFHYFSMENLIKDLRSKVEKATVKKVKYTMSEEERQERMKNYVFTFGKYKGVHISKVPQEYIDFIEARNKYFFLIKSKV